MPRLIALKPIGRYRPGDEFDVRSRSDARLLKAIGKAQDAPPPAAPKPERRTAAAVEDDEPERVVPRYRRRDMVAEEA